MALAQKNGGDLKMSESPTGPKLLDLEKLVKKVAEGMIRSKDIKKVDLENPDIIWDRMFVTHGETKYGNTRQSKPSANVLFTANFSNNTLTTQRYTLNTERRTKSTCHITLSKSYTIGASVEIKLNPPFVEANTGFHGELTMQKGRDETFEQELAWSVNNEIDVPPGCVTQADLIINEKEFDGDITTESTFEGEVVVRYETKKQPREHFTTVVCDVKDFMTHDAGFKIDQEGTPSFISRGRCKCRFGIEQNVVLKESKLNTSSISQTVPT